MSRFAVVGGGETGAGWAARFLLNGWDVAVAGTDVTTVLDQARRVLPMLYECALPAEGRLIAAESDAEALNDADAAFVADPGALSLAGNIPVFTPDKASKRNAVAVTSGDPVFLWPLVVFDADSCDPALVERAEAILESVGMARGDDPLPVSEVTPSDRDRVLVALLRAFKRENSGAGRVIAAHERTLDQSMHGTGPLITVRRVIPSDWTDYNGHMNESRYGQIWSDAADRVLLEAGADSAYIARGLSYFTVETKTCFLGETLAGERIRCETRVALADGKKLRLVHEMKRETDGGMLATCDQFLVHVSLETRRSCLPEPAVLKRIEAFMGRD